jgi:DNA-binding response OmpR family regulator
MYNILVIEDEKQVSEVIKAYLEKEGYKVYCASRGLEGLDLFSKVGNIKLVILDLMLPDIDGEEVCETLRKISDVYIFMLTAKVTLADKIEGLNAGADEYITKPCSPRELTARVNALYRRVKSLGDEKIVSSDGKLIINPDKRIVKLYDTDIPMTPNEFDILYTIAKNKGKVLTREQLIEKVFGIDFEGSDRTVDVHITNLRTKFAECNAFKIVTVRGLGYKAVIL